MELVRPSVIYKDSFLEAVEELSEADRGQLVYNGLNIGDWKNDFSAYVARILQLEKAPPKPLVNDTVWWAVEGSRVLGRIAFRHELTECLRNIGGHIGYAVRPSERKQGLATEMLYQVLRTDLARKVGLVLVTCNEFNLASIKTILKNGGVASGFYQDPGEKGRTLHFWIDTTQL